MVIIVNEDEANQSNGDSDIVSRNKDIEYIVNAAANYGHHAVGMENADRRLSLLVTTDIHKCERQLQSAVHYINHMPCFHLGVTLGDMQAITYGENDGTWYTNIIRHSNVPWLTVLGNHDHGDSNTRPRSGSAAEVTAKFITPNNPYAGVNTDTAYYFKDMDDFAIRIIVLDCYDTPDDIVDGHFTVGRGAQVISQAQADWLVDTLNATPARYGVVILTHAIPHEMVEDSAKRFNTAKGVPNNEDRQDGILCDIVNAWVKGEAYAKNYVASVQGIPDVLVHADFISRGTGTFVGYFCGHEHSDSVGYIRRYPDQNVVVFAATANDLWQNGTDDLPRAVGTKAEDAITALCISMNTRDFCLVRIGSDTSKFLQKREPTLVTF